MILFKDQVALSGTNCTFAHLILWYLVYDFKNSKNDVPTGSGR